VSFTKIEALPLAHTRVYNSGCFGVVCTRIFAFLSA
jgi:hypothetical protein